MSMFSQSSTSHSQATLTHKDTTTKGKIKRDVCDFVNNKKLEALYNAFRERSDEKDSGLTTEEFKDMFLNTMCSWADPQVVEKLYDKIDSWGKGLVSWADYISVLSETMRNKAYTVEKAVKPLFKNTMNFTKTSQRDEIISIRFLPRLILNSKQVDYNNGRYVMLGRTGALSIWSLELSLMSTYHLPIPADGVESKFFMDMVVLYPAALIAVTATDCRIVIYELSSHGPTEKYSIVALKNCVTCMDYWTDLSDRTYSILVWGDTGGAIQAVELNVSRQGSIFGVDKHQEMVTRIRYPDLLKNRVPLVTLHQMPTVHQTWVNAVKYIPEKKAFLSCSSSEGQSLCYCDWMGQPSIRYFQAFKTVLCLDYSHALKYVVTGCLDCVVRVWNVYLTNQPILILKGHTAPVTHVALHEASQNVISMDKLHGVMVHDYEKGTLVQTFTKASMTGMGSTPAGGFFLNRARVQLITATNTVAEAVKSACCTVQNHAHDKPVSALCYSRTFEEVLTACTSGVIKVWDVMTGRLLIQFEHYTPDHEMQNISWAQDNRKLASQVMSKTEIEVTAMTLASSDRTVVTGANDGTVNLWNFSAGLLLAHFCLPDGKMVTGLAVSNDVIYATGWTNQVHLFGIGRGKACVLRQFWRWHKEDVNCIALPRGDFMLTGAYNGDILVQTRDKGRTYFLLNAAKSQQPINLKALSLHTHRKDDYDKRRGLVKKKYRSWKARSRHSRVSENQSKKSCDDANSDINPWKATRNLSGLSGVSSEPVVSSSESSTFSTDTGLVYDVLQGRYVSKVDSEASVKTYESSVDFLLCLNTRKQFDIHTAEVLSAGTEGWIRAWSLNHLGGLLGQFLATVELGQTVRAMATDDHNDYLITGDTQGYIKVWDLFPYCNAAADVLPGAEHKERDRLHRQMFIFLRSPHHCDKAAGGFPTGPENRKHYPPSESKPEKTLKTPKLLNVYQAHLKAISAVEYITDKQAIISASNDCSVRVWTLAGTFIGFLGQPWDSLPEPSVQVTPTPHIPRDIRRYGSARTLRVTRAGYVTFWPRVLKAAKDMSIKGLEVKAEEESDEADSTDTTTEDRDVPEDVRRPKQTTYSGKRRGLSKVLGRTYKSGWRRRSPTLAPLVDDGSGVMAIYRRLPIADLCDVRISTPQIVKETRARQKKEKKELRNILRRHPLRKPPGFGQTSTASAVQRAQSLMSEAVDQTTDGSSGSSSTQTISTSKASRVSSRLTDHISRRDTVAEWPKHLSVADAVSGADLDSARSRDELNKQAQATCRRKQTASGRNTLQENLKQPLQSTNVNNKRDEASNNNNINSDVTGVHSRVYAHSEGVVSHGGTEVTKNAKSLENEEISHNVTGKQKKQKLASAPGQEESERLSLPPIQQNTNFLTPIPTGEGCGHDSSIPVLITITGTRQKGLRKTINKKEQFKGAEDSLPSLPTVSSSQ